VKRLVTIAGEAASLEWSEAAEGLSVRFERNGAGLALDGVSVLRVQDGIYSVLAGGRSYEVKIIPGPAGQGGWFVDVSGHHLPVALIDPRDARHPGAGLAGDGRQNIGAPMPGKVVRVLVEEGQMVAAGEGLVVVEAMKMQNEMKSPRAGRVCSVTAKAGQTVEAGEVLVAVE
jgi:multidrug efflux pump subunit AcrA (membrane-fusion protein)